MPVITEGNSNNYMESVAFCFTYPQIILDVDISSLVYKISHIDKIATFNCIVQGSQLMD